MKNIIHGLLGAALLTSSAFGAVSNKTFMAARGTLSDNVVMGMTAAACGKKSGFGADVSVAGFFRQSHNNKDLAKYFGSGLTDTAREGKISNSTNSLYGAADATATLDPRRTEFGGHIQWNQCLGKVLKGLSFSVNVPVVRVETEMRTTYGDANITGFFQGDALTAPTPDSTALAYQKHSATKRHETGVANVDVAVNYEFAREADYSVGGSLVLEIPTGNKPSAVWAFEPLYGSKHFALGAGLNADFNLWKSEGGSRFDFCAGVNYKYGFKAKEIRTMGIYDATNTADVDAGHYAALTTGAAGATKPAANVTSLEMDVTPQSSIDAVAGFKYKTGQFGVNVAYNLNWNQEEKVAAPTYTATTYGRGDGTVDTDHINLHANGALAAATATTGDRVSTTACTTPSRVTHKVGGGINYSLNTKTPIRFGVFGEGEWNANNDSINSWAVGGKVGFCF